MRFAPLLAAFAAAAGLVGFTTVTGQPPEKAKTADGDLVRLQGEWAVSKIELPSGELLPAELVTSMKVTIRENRATAEFTGPAAGKDEPVYALLQLDSTKTPRHVDVISADAKGQPRRRVVRSTAKGGKDRDDGPMPTVPGLYRLDGDALTVCVPAEPKGVRPTALKASPPKDPNTFRSDDRGYILVHLTRKK